MKRRLLIILCFVLIPAAYAADPLSPKERGALSTLMVNLSSAVDTYFSMLTEPPTEKDNEILAFATSPDPSLLSPKFNDYQLKVQYQDHYAVVLLCDDEGKHALMEDAGCSARLDRQVTTASPCEFALKVSANCKVKGGDPEAK